MMTINRRRVMGKNGAPLPYDAEVEYIESSGDACIDTGFFPNENSTIIIDAELATYGQDVVLFSAALGWSFNKWMLFYTSYSIYWATSNSSTRYYSPIRQEYKIIGAFLYINNRPFRNSQPAFSSGQVDTSLHLFSHGDKSRNSTGKLFGVKISDNLFSADFIPVRVGTTGYLYDKVSGALFGSEGTGAFIVGPDK